MGAAQQLQWGVVGTGGIGADFVQALRHSSKCRVVNVVGSSREKGSAFAERWGVPSSSATLNDLLADPEVDAIYVATPHSQHELPALAALKARKAVLCEKPATSSVIGFSQSTALRALRAASAGNSC